MRPTQWTTPEAVTVGWMRQFRYFIKMYEYIRWVPGDVVECGLGRGGTFSMLACLIGSEESSLGRLLWGFDSFEGWPEPTEWDRSPRNPQRGEWKVPEGEVRKLLEDSEIFKAFPKLEVEIVPGFFADSLPLFPQDRSIAFLHLDCDLYISYRDALANLFPRVAEGGIVLFDEYKEFSRTYGGAEKWPGATKAIDDYFAGTPYRIQYYPETKKYYVIKRS